MIVTCENCDVKYFVSENKIGENGRVVRCTFCEHEWLLHNPKHYKNLSQLPPKKLFERILLNIRSRTLASTILVVCFLIAVVMFAQRKELQWIIEGHKAEYLLSESMILDVVSYKIEKKYDVSINGERKWLLVTMTIRNAAEYEQKLDRVRIIGLSFKQEEIMHFSVSPSEAISSGDSAVITVRVPIVSVMPSYIKILLNKERGNKPTGPEGSKNLIKIDNR